jgi:hypothetical protein
MEMMVGGYFSMDEHVKGSIKLYITRRDFSMERKEEMGC